MSPVCTIDVASPCTEWNRFCPGARSLARKAARLALVQGSAAAELVWQERVEVGIILADAAEQQRLNREHRGKDSPTNVLAFPAWEPGIRIPPLAPVLLGDVVLALETVVSEASDQHKPVAHHMRHLVVHGVLHLLGYDHITPAEAEVMESLERSVLAELGVPDPYRDPMSSSGPVASHE